MAPQSFKITLSDALLSQVSQFAKGLTLTDEDKAEGFYGEDGGLDVPAVLAYLTGPGTYLVSRPLALNKARAIMLAAKGTITPAAFAEVYGDAEARNSHRPVKAPKAPRPVAPAASPTFDPLAAPAPAAPVKALVDPKRDAAKMAAKLEAPAPVKAPKGPTKAQAVKALTKVVKEMGGEVVSPQPPTKRKAAKVDALPPHSKACTCKACQPAPAAPLALV